MIELDRHIEILLLSNDCVIVPGFGGFMAHHVDARYDERDGMFIPPLRTLGFNPQLQLNDSLLAQSYIDAYDISYPEAIRRIESEVAELRQRLSNEGRYELNDIGVLYVNEDGRYVFEPCESGVLTPEYYGLGSFSLTSAEMAEVEVLSRPPAEKAQIVEMSPKQAETICVNIGTLRNVAAACLLAIVLFLFPSQTNTTGDDGIIRSHIDTGMLHRMMPKDITTDSKVVAARVKAIKDSTAMAAKTEKAKADVPRVSYCIVLASQVSLKNATAFVNRLHEEGYMQAEVLKVEGHSTKVVYGHYNSESEAYNALNRLSNKQHFTDGWVMKVNS